MTEQPLRKDQALTPASLAAEIEAYVDYVKTLPNVDELNLIMIETVLSSFGHWLMRDWVEGEES